MGTPVVGSKEVVSKGESNPKKEVKGITEQEANIKLTKINERMERGRSHFNPEELTKELYALENDIKSSPDIRSGSQKKLLLDTERTKMTAGLVALGKPYPDAKAESINLIKEDRSTLYKGGSIALAAIAVPAVGYGIFKFGQDQGWWGAAAAIDPIDSAQPGEIVEKSGYNALDTKEIRPADATTVPVDVLTKYSGIKGEQEITLAQMQAIWADLPQSVRDGIAVDEQWQVFTNGDKKDIEYVGFKISSEVTGAMYVKTISHRVDPDTEAIIQYTSRPIGFYDNSVVNMLYLIDTKAKSGGQ